MFMRPVKALATLGIFCGMTLATTAGQISTPSINVNQSVSPGIYSILNKEQLQEHKKWRIYANQDVARTIDSDPQFPYRSRPLYSFVGAEYFYSPRFSLGCVVVYAHQKDVYSRTLPGILSQNVLVNSGGILPYANYMVSPSWLLTAQIGGYSENYKSTSMVADGTKYTAVSQVFTPNAEAYVTWLGPDTMYTASVRAGVIYNNQRFRSIYDSSGNFFPTRHFETGAAAASVRLKYHPHNPRWNVFLHAETAFRFFAGARPGVYHPDSRRQNQMFQVGPGVHFKLNHIWELRILALHTDGFGYGKEERIGVRLRAAI